MSIAVREGSGFDRTRITRMGAVCAALTILAALMVVDLVTGPAGLPLSDVLKGLRDGPDAENRRLATILWHLRMPQTLMAALVGAALGIAGLMMQTILNNPLASPYTLGFSAAAGFGAALVILFGTALPVAMWIGVPLAAFAATLVAAGLVYLVAHLRGASPEMLVLAGIAVLFLFQSLQSLLQFMAAPEVLQQIVFWLFGSLLKATWTSVQVLSAILAVTLPLIAREVWNLTSLRLGEGNAASLGLNVERLRLRVLVIIALLTAGAVSFTGTIGFVGLIAPHVGRALVGEDHRFGLPMAAIMGAVVLVAASVLGKIISPGAVIPVGIITAIAGIPMLLAIILLKGRT
ncbi:iron-siderophore ABC transporter permease [Phaeobacter gallaeciensis]|uniref:Iron ABC transporter permease n=1 Tax=Phaeobacter gallaeciensis TaxID=60890 RepID=A0A1B0ZPI1_9RHOB|nr:MULTISPECIES: iron ABC transporter permease [Phaeobacter]MDF1770714.1 iron ABC transporter permease [Pseudophaeobacter sp. bin_em_oilr2.035]ANP36008.1 iron-siderophore ABC transporter permease [Phaeobacter gallaeciensis]MDE4146687.1 iron ABC transporter permease [Phaeobacter gallaeciensis]MDE4159360.1 iron ABC transporter permease [Phaeobacter gallaeciensis]MDE4163525.1 iron ABC transporter permease [Phaeobacter gallaeciensis]